ncbi:protein secretion system [Rhodopirellula islandica]|uniref:Protein secretion system n=1 Tax=Rhodopirellula islandica TaxID=595434 RepID=A0A0J1B7U3_RHOIS|nr:MMPL family transporter [Rhodopirellula islandica]KLU02516.1 protein secretion system [Rhodopirellula islandica]
MRTSLIAAPRHGLARFLWVGRWWLFCMGCLSAIPLAIYQTDLGMDRSLAAMFSPSDPTLNQYQHLQQTFGGNLVVMLVYDDTELMTPEGVARNQKWTQSAESIEGVRGVLSVAKLVQAFAYIRPQFSLLGGSIPSNPEATPAPSKMLAEDDPVANSFRELFAGYTHGRDEQTAAIVAMLQPGHTESAIKDLQRLADQIPSQRAPVLVGEPVLLDDAFDMIQADGNRLALGTIGLLSLVMLLTLRDYRVVLLAAMAIAWATVCTRASIVALGMEMSLVSTILIAIIAVIVVAAVMHLGVRSRDSAGENVSSNSSESTVRVIAFLAIPILWTCLTDAAGFASLLKSDVRPVQQFGAMTAVAAVAIVAALIWFTPALMSLPSGKREQSHETPLDDRRSPSKRFLVHLVSTSLRHRKLLSMASVIALILCTIMVTRLKTETSFLSNFRDSSRIVQAYERVEQQLGGAGVWDVVLPAPDTITPEYANRVREFETELRELEVVDSVTGQTHGLTKVLSLADADEVAAMSPLLSLVTPEVRLAGMRTAIPTFADALLTFDPPQEGSQRQLRIMLRSEEGLPGEVKRKLIERVSQAAQGFDERSLVTGYSVLMSQLVSSLLRDQWNALAIALTLVGLLIGIATGSVRYAIVALLTNTLPVMFVLALMGLVGGGLDLGSAMIGAVSIGLSIDGSIHFLAGYQRGRVAGLDPSTAATEAATDVATPILLATLALVVGFGILMTSPFIPTATFGMLIAATLAASAATNLMLLPAVIVAVDRRTTSP